MYKIKLRHAITDIILNLLKQGMTSELIWSNKQE